MSMRRTGGILTVAALVTATLAACGDGSDIYAQVPAQADREVDLSVDLGNGIVGGITQSDMAGEYLQVTLTDDSPLMTLDTELIDPAALEAFSETRIAQALRVASMFTVQEGLDSTLLFDYDEERAQAWLDDNAAIFHPDHADALTAGILDGEDERIELIDTHSGRWITEGGETVTGEWSRSYPAYSGGPRWHALDVQLEGITLTKDHALEFDYAVMSDIPVLPVYDRLSTSQGLETNEHQLRYTFADDDGDWKLARYDNSLTTTSEGIDEDHEAYRPSPVPVAEHVDPGTIDLGNGVIGGEPQSDSIGNYVQITLAEDSPLMTLDTNVTWQDALDVYSEGEILEVQQIASRFTIEEAIDSRLVFDYTEEAAQEWLDEHDDLIHPFNADAISESLLEGDTRSNFIDTNAGRHVFEDGETVSGHWTRMHPVYDGGARWESLDVALDAVRVQQGDVLYFYYSVEGVRPGVNPLDRFDPSVQYEVVSFNLKYGFRQEAGSWQLITWENSLPVDVVDDYDDVSR